MRKRKGVEENKAQEKTKERGETKNDDKEKKEKWKKMRMGKTNVGGIFGWSG